MYDTEDTKKEIGQKLATSGTAGRVWPATVAALDVGSNSFHLMVAEASSPQRITVIDRAKEMVRLGETLRDGAIPPEAFARGLDALERLRDVAARHRPEAIVAVATSAVREAANGNDFVAAAHQRLGLTIRPIDGIEEARLIYLGARAALGLGQQRVALFDLGGGSTEAVLGDAMGCLWATSLKMGGLRLRGEVPVADPPGDSGRAALEEHVRALVGPTVQHMLRQGFDQVAFTSGTALALARLAGEPLPPVGGAQRYRLPLSALRWCERTLATLSSSERATFPGLEPRRNDTIVPGDVALRTILEMTGASAAVVCDAALREGVLSAYLADRGRPSFHDDINVAG